MPILDAHIGSKAGFKVAKMSLGDHKSLKYWANKENKRLVHATVVHFVYYPIIVPFLTFNTIPGVFQATSLKKCRCRDL